jgi:hypothetical protein
LSAATIFMVHLPRTRENLCYWQAKRTQVFEKECLRVCY